MYGFSMVQLVRKNGKQIDYHLRKKLVNLYRPFRYTPCTFHKMLENWLKRYKKFPVIIEFHNHGQGMIEIENNVPKKHHYTIKDHFPSVSCCSAYLTAESIESILSSCNHVNKIYLDREVNALLDVAIPTIGADQVYQRDNSTKLSGKGVTIAIIDTGIYPHQDLVDRIIGFKDFINNKTEPYDDNGHGTHCAGDAAGNGLASNGVFKGPSYEANLIGVKVLDKIGSGSLSTVMNGVQWCIDYNNGDNDNKINIISMSLGSEAQRYDQENNDPMVQIVESAWNAGITVCVAAGNSGDAPESIASPGLSDQVITVGAMDDQNTVGDDDQIARFSSRGPTIYNEIKPDVVTPGVNIVSTRAPNSYLDKFQKGNRIDKDYFVLSGTSMSTPICAGVIAQLIELEPNLTPEQIKYYLKTGAVSLGDNNTYGAGYVNVENTVGLIKIDF